MIGITDPIEYINQGIFDEEEAAYRRVQSDKILRKGSLYLVPE